MRDAGRRRREFCGNCGASLAARPVEDAGARKVVTIVFPDLVGSTALHERLDAESARPFMEHYYRAMRGAVEAHGGTVTKPLGGGGPLAFDEHLCLAEVGADGRFVAIVLFDLDDLDAAYGAPTPSPQPRWKPTASRSRNSARRT